jgi:hypothetical protein
MALHFLKPTALPKHYRVLPPRGSDGVGLSVVKTAMPGSTWRSFELPDPYCVAQEGPGWADALANPLFLLIVSPALRRILEARGAALEVISVRIVDEKLRTLSADYSVMNPRTIVDCVDLERSGTKFNRIDPKKIFSTEHLTLRVDAVPTDASVFRLTGWAEKIVVDEEVARAIVNASMTGVALVPVEGYKGA